jgi:integrase
VSLLASALLVIWAHVAQLDEVSQNIERICAADVGRRAARSSLLLVHGTRQAETPWLVAARCFTWRRTSAGHPARSWLARTRGSAFGSCRLFRGSGGSVRIAATVIKEFMESVRLDAAGHRRSPATMPGYHRGRPARNKGEEYPADPPMVEEIVAVMRAAGDRPDGHRLRALIVLLRRAGLRVCEALALQESELDRGRGGVLVR